MLASMNKHKDVVQVLISAKADINLQSNVCGIYDRFDGYCFVL